MSIPEPTPLHLICGFLGAGKTTLLRRILAQQPADESLAVLVNEFGKLGIDGELLSGFSSQVRELRAGCICCELRVDFLRTLAEVLTNFQPQRVVVETTGVADPRDLITAVQEVGREHPLALASVVTVVDAEMFPVRRMFGPFYLNQIKAGDLVLLNKTDLIEPEAVEPAFAALSQINPGARLLPVVHCAVERELILDPQGRGLRPAGQEAVPDLSQIASLAGPDHRPGEDGFVSFFFESESPLRRQCLDEFLAGLPWEMFRVKGFVRTEAGPLALNYTYRRPSWEPTAFSGPSRLACVGWRLEPAEFLGRLAACRG
ncbi:MAG: cobalamin biosynthesis protein CobW [Desulfarculus sp.]|nr:MAG: cobalamin biosynthesis protein CobW [Desulfarculus sp.]